MPSRPTIGSTRTAATPRVAGGFRGEVLRHALEVAGEGQAADVRRELGGKGGAEGAPRGRGEGAEVQAVVAGVEGEKPAPAGGEERGLPGDLDRVGAGDREVDARRVDRRHRAEPRRERDPRRVRGDVAEAVQELGRLPRDSSDDARVAVADGGGAETGGEVDEAVAVDVEDIGAERRAARPRRARRPRPGC